MNIIFGDDAALVSDNYTKLELDTIQVAGKRFTAYCLVENIPLAEFPHVESNKRNHATLIEKYRQRCWDECTELIKLLQGAWNGEVDTFYQTLQGRIEDFKKNPPDQAWDGTVV